MIYKNKRRLELQRKKKWHNWFAWHPVDLEGTNDKAWLCYVERKLSTVPGMYAYVVKYRKRK